MHPLGMMMESSSAISMLMFMHALVVKHDGGEPVDEFVACLGLTVRVRNGSGGKDMIRESFGERRGPIA